MSIITLGEVEKLKLYRDIEQEYRAKRRDMQHHILQKMEGTFVYGIGFDNIERLDVEDDCVESSFDLGKKYYNKNDFMKDHNDLYELFMCAEYADGAVNPFLSDGNLIEISVKIKLYFYSATAGPQVHVYLGFDNVGELLLKFTICEDSQNKSETETFDTCSEEHVEDFIKWFCEHDVFKL